MPSVAKPPPPNADVPTPDHGDLELASFTEVLSPLGRDRFLKRWLRASEPQGWSAICWVAAIGCLPVIVSALEGTLTAHGPRLRMGLLDDVGYWACFVLQPAAILWGMKRYFGRIGTTLDELVASGALVPSPSALDAENGPNRYFRKKWLVVAPLTVTALAAAIGFLAFTNSRDQWLSLPNGRYAGLFVAPAAIVLFYLIPAAVFRLLATRQVLREVFRAGLRVQPMHPDGAGGLAPLARLCFQMNAVVIALGFVTLASMWSNVANYSMSWTHPVNILIGLAYLFGSFVAFFLPIGAAHDPMHRARQAALSEINARFEVITEAVRKGLRARRDPSAEDIERLERIAKLHAWAASMPVFPLSTRVVSTFLSSILIPIATALVIAWIQDGVQALASRLIST